MGSINYFKQIEDIPYNLFLQHDEWMNIMVTSQYQPMLSSITNVATGGSANQSEVFTSN